MAVQPGRSIPQLCGSPYAVKATYNLFKHEEATPDNIKQGIGPSFCKRCASLECISYSKTPTELSWSGKQAIAGLGPIGNSAAGLQGFFLHTVLGVRWQDAAPTNSTRRPVEVLGLGTSNTTCERHVAVPESRVTRAAETRRSESQVWPQASQRVGRAPAGVRWIRVADREADIYEYLVSCRNSATVL